MGYHILEFCKLQPRYSYKIYSYRKQKSVHICYSPAGRSVLGETVPVLTARL